MENPQGETDLQYLLSNMQPVLEKDEIVFCSIPPEKAKEFLPYCQGFYREEEGVTVILAKQDAELNNLPFTTVFHRISLMVHSSLEAVGFLARITEVLAAQGISVNVVSGYYHDHLYIKIDQAENALRTLELWQSKLRE